ncbi:hypothetical protein CPB86DRAFT_814669 [Serendipita vermifera]|nr:hypothetical protein CPB86DRAFT_814669 [Serendipita vermifera]
MSTAAEAQQLQQRKPLKPQPANDGVASQTESAALLKDRAKANKLPGKARSLSLNFSFAFRMILLVRFCAAIYSNIADCDEVFNFWEPLHYVSKGYGFQTWEVSPAYAIRSWAYIFLHYPFVAIGSFLSDSKQAPFFAVRTALAAISSLCEARFFLSVVESVGESVGMYLFVMLLTSAGMWNASTAFLPSTFSMYFNMLAFSFAVQLAKSRRPNPTDSRTLFATVLFGAGAIIGWPFSILVSFPFVFEELFVYSGDRVADNAVGKWLTERWIRIIGSVVLASFLFMPMIAIDSIAYGKFTVTLWNIISYNIFGGAERGPDLYGTEPWHFYILNLVLNFNVLTLLAMLSLPILIMTSYLDYSRVASAKSSNQESSPYFLLGIRLAPFYLWTLTLSLQAHKEERFMFPVYPLLCFNASVALHLLRGWLEKLYARITSPYQASKSYAVRSMTTNVLLASAVISVLRIAALFQYYHAPIAVAVHFENFELPRLLNATNLLSPPQDGKYGRSSNVDLSPIKQLGLRLCTGKEWYRFPGHFLVPDGVEVRFLKSEFDGLLPQPFPPSTGASSVWPWDGMRVVPEGLNDLNKENKAYYVDAATCDYLVDLDYPLHPRESINEPRYAEQDSLWTRVHCQKFLDAAHSSVLSRILWLPGGAWRSMNEYGDYCLLRNNERATMREGQSTIVY